MPVFQFVARNPAGRTQKGTQEAPSAADVVSTLRQRGWLVLDVRADAGQAATTNLLTLLNPFSWLPPRSVDVEIALQQMAVMLRSGLTLLTTLKSIAEYASNANMRRTWEEIADKIQRGSGLSDAMSGHRCFTRMVVQLVHIGEQTGTLDQVVIRAADALQRRRLLRNQVLTALFYPVIVLVSAIGATAFLIVFLIPKLQVFLRVLGRKLPPITQRLLDVADFVQNYGLYIVAGILALTAVLIAIYLWPPGRLLMDRIVLRVPLIGFLLRLGVTVQFAYSLAVLLRSGITLVEGLRTVEQLHRNHWVADKVAQTRNAVLKGGSLAEPLAARGIFMPMLSRMVAVGESAGTLDDVLMEVGKFHENQLQATIKLYSTIIEPVITVVVGSIVGFVYIAVFMALFAAAGGK